MDLSLVYTHSLLEEICIEKHRGITMYGLRRQPSTSLTNKSSPHLDLWLLASKTYISIASHPAWGSSSWIKQYALHVWNVVNRLTIFTETFARRSTVLLVFLARAWIKEREFPAAYLFLASPFGFSSGGSSMMSWQDWAWSKLFGVFGEHWVSSINTCRNIHTQGQVRSPHLLTSLTAG